MPNPLAVRALTNGHGQPWDRLPDESSVAFAAFEAFRTAPPPRRLSEVARTLSKSRQLLTRWAARHRWQERADAFDQEEAKALDQATLATKARLRAKLIEAAADVIDLPPLSLEEKASLSVIERSVLLKTAASIAEGDDLDEPRAGRFPADMQAPTFTIRVIRPGFAQDGSRMVAVQFEDESGVTRYGYIPESRCDEAQADHPEWRFMR